MANSANRRNGALWAGTLLTLAALLSNGLYFLRPPFEKAVPSLTAGLGAVAFICLVVAARRAFAAPETYWGKAAGPILAVVSALLFGFSIFFWIHARQLPAPAGAPAVGQKAPDFTLTDSDGRTVSLAQLLAPDTGNGSGAHPKTVLLIFYRGYW